MLSGAAGVVFTPNGSTVYVSDFSSGIAPASVVVINTAIGMVTTGIPLGVFASPWGIAVSPDGSRVSHWGVHPGGGQAEQEREADGDHAAG